MWVVAYKPTGQSALYVNDDPDIVHSHGLPYILKGTAHLTCVNELLFGEETRDGQEKKH